MNGMNALFQKDPAGFLQGMCVDNKTMQQGLEGAANINALNVTKLGKFDLVITGGNQVQLKVVTPGYVVKGDVAIEAYWCPFLQGTGLPGWVDIPRDNIRTRLVLTAAMQGCAFAVTNSPDAAGSVRVFHNQHPENDATWNAIRQTNATEISRFGYDQYGNATSGSDGGMTNAFNLLWSSDGKSWNYVSQSNSFVPLPKGFDIKRDTAKPILTVPTGV